MRSDASGLAIIFVVLFCQNAKAYPDGAPWGAANPDAEENCSSCHFDGEAQRDSPALSVEGLPGALSADTLYELLVTFDNPEGVAAGFQMIAGAGDETAGIFTSETDNTETAGSAIRSTAPVQNKGPVTWSLQWHTPKVIDTTITIYLAASAANSDQSALGDNIYFRHYQFAAGDD
jgi:hypothetical protein